MAGIRFFGIHRTWEDWVGVVLAVLITLSPWFAGQVRYDIAMVNGGLIGLLVFALAAVELVELYPWEETGEIACGLWLIASPYVFDYAGTPLQYWHLGLGVVVALLAILELWQDWKLSKKEIAEDGAK